MRAKSDARLPGHRSILKLLKAPWLSLSWVTVLMGEALGSMMFRCEQPSNDPVCGMDGVPLRAYSTVKPCEISGVAKDPSRRTFQPMLKMSLVLTSV